MSKLDWTKADLPSSDPARVLDVGVGWLPDQVIAAQRRKRKAALKKASRSNRAVDNAVPLIIPEAKAELVASILRDLGRNLPSKRNRLNNRLKKLIDDGFISKVGEIATNHPIMVEWFAVMEKRSRRDSET